MSSLKPYIEDAPLSSFSIEDKGYSDNDEANEFISNNSFAFTCGLIFDQAQCGANGIFLDNVKDYIPMYSGMLSQKVDDCLRK